MSQIVLTLGERSGIINLVTKRDEQNGGDKMNDAKTIGERLLKLRLSERKTQKEVTEAIGISVSALTMYETGNRIPRDEIKVKLAHYYSTSVERLFYA